MVNPFLSSHRHSFANFLHGVRIKFIEMVFPEKGRTLGDEGAESGGSPGAGDGRAAEGNGKDHGSPAFHLRPGCV